MVIRLWFELITAYTLQQLDEEQCQFFLMMSHEFLDQSALILNLAPSMDYTICSETLMILIILCESYEDASPLLCQAWYDPNRFERCQFWPALAQLITKGIKAESRAKVHRTENRKENAIFFRFNGRNLQRNSDVHCCDDGRFNLSISMFTR